MSIRRIFAFGRIVFDVIPHAVSDFHQLVADAFGVADGVEQATDFEPPEVVRLHAFHAVRQIFGSREFIGPTRRRNEL